MQNGIYFASRNLSNKNIGKIPDVVQKRKQQSNNKIAIEHPN